MNLKLTNIKPDDYILAVRAAKSFLAEEKPIGIRHGTIIGYRAHDGVPWEQMTSFYVYRVKTGIVVRYSQ